MTDLKINTAENLDLNNKLQVLTEQFNYKVTSKTTEDEINNLYEQYVRDYVNSLGLGLTTVIMECGDVVVYGDDEYTYTVEEIIENGITQIELEIEQMTVKNVMYNVIAKCSDGDIKIGKDGIYDFDIDQAWEIADAHKTLGVEINIVTANKDEYEETV